MNKKTFDIINAFQGIENDIYYKLKEKGVSTDDIEDILEESVNYREELLRIGKHSVEDEYINRDTYIKSKYENIESYTKLNVIYEYENDMALCETTSGLIYLVPQELLHVEVK